MPAAPYQTYSAEHSAVYAANLAQASAPRLAMSCVVASTPSAGTYGTSGVLNPFFGSWCRGRRLRGIGRRDRGAQRDAARDE